jgi:hypothetical protein
MVAKQSRFSAIASRSTGLPILRSRKMMRRSCSTSRATSCRIASAVFFLRRLCLLLDGTDMTDLGVDVDKLTAESFEFAELGDFPLRFAQRGRVWQRLRNSLAFRFKGQPGSRTVGRLVGLVTAAVGLTTAAAGGRNRTPGGDRPVGRSDQQSGRAVVARIAGILVPNGASFSLADLIRTDYEHKSEELVGSSLLCRAPADESKLPFQYGI